MNSIYLLLFNFHATIVGAGIKNKDKTTQCLIFFIPYSSLGKKKAPTCSVIIPNAFTSTPCRKEDICGPRGCWLFWHVSVFV